MRAVVVVVLQLLVQHDAEVMCSGDQEVVEAFSAEGGDERSDWHVDGLRLPLLGNNDGLGGVGRGRSSLLPVQQLRDGVVDNSIHPPR
jgi:hypothetical protein